MYDRPGFISQESLALSLQSTAFIRPLFVSQVSAQCHIRRQEACRPFREISRPFMCAFNSRASFGTQCTCARPTLGRSLLFRGAVAHAGHDSVVPDQRRPVGLRCSVLLLLGEQLRRHRRARDSHGRGRHSRRRLQRRRRQRGLGVPVW